MAKRKSLKTLANEMMAKLYKSISYDLNPESLKIVLKYFKLVKENK